MSSTNKTIYLVRHGQTDYNLQGIVQGSGVDSDLNDTGQKQANAFFEAYKHISFDHVYTSELKRTHQSVQQFTSSGLDTTILPELNEINWGVFEGVQTTPESKRRFNSIVQSWREGKVDQRIDGGESPMDMFNRQKAGWSKIQGDPHKTVLICMHGRAMRSFLSLILETDLSDMDNYPHSNLCLYVLENGSGGWSLRVKNDVRHLAAIPS